MHVLKAKNDFSIKHSSSDHHVPTNVINVLNLNNVLNVISSIMMTQTCACARGQGWPLRRKTSSRSRWTPRAGTGGSAGHLKIIDDDDDDDYNGDDDDDDGDGVYLKAVNIDLHANL